MGVRSVHTFQSEAVAMGNGTEHVINYNHNGELIMVLDISGTSTTRTVIFEGAGENGNYQAMAGYKMLDLTTASQTTGNDELR